MNQQEKLLTPYDGSAKPFTIGLKPFDLADWLDVDANLAAYLHEKQRLTREKYNDVFVAETGTEQTQLEVLDLITQHICKKFPEHYQKNASTIQIKSTDKIIDLNDQSIPKLHLAASLIQDDLVIMRHGETGWRLAAASLCFPSAWNLHEKFSKPMHEIHTPVPGFGSGTRNADLIDRMFNNLKVEQPVMRWNWSVYGDALLHHPQGSGEGKLRFGQNAEPENIYLRLERQTLRKLPVSKDLLFTIRIYVDPLEKLKTSPDGPALAQALVAQLNALSSEELAYKGLNRELDRLTRHLQEVMGLLT